MSLVITHIRDKNWFLRKIEERGRELSEIATLIIQRANKKREVIVKKNKKGIEENEVNILMDTIAAVRNSDIDPERKAKMIKELIKQSTHKKS